VYAGGWGEGCDPTGVGEDDRDAKGRGSRTRQRSGTNDVDARAEATTPRAARFTTRGGGGATRAREEADTRRSPGGWGRPGQVGKEGAVFRGPTAADRRG
jgi:hypothetical protein